MNFCAASKKSKGEEENPDWVKSDRTASWSLSTETRADPYNTAIDGHCLVNRSRCIFFFFPCVFALTDVTSGGLTFKQEKKRNSLYLYSTEIKLSDWLDKTFSGLFFSSSFFLFLATAHQKKKKIHHTRRAGRWGAEA